MFTPADRDATLARAIELLEADERVEAAVISGSLGAGTADDWSDFDLDAVIAEGASADLVTRDWEALAYREWPVVHHYTTAFGATRVRGFLLDNGLLADLAFTPVAEFSIWAPVEIAFDRGSTVTKLRRDWKPWAPTPDWGGEAGFAFHDVLHACTAALRGQPWRANFYLQRIRNRTLALASERHGWDAEEFARVDDLPPAERDPLLRSLVLDLERETLLRVTEAATHAFLDELRRGDPTLADRLTGPLLRFISAAASQSASASPPGPSPP